MVVRIVTFSESDIHGVRAVLLTGVVIDVNIDRAGDGDRGKIATTSANVTRCPKKPFVPFLEII